MTQLINKKTGRTYKIKQFFNENIGIGTVCSEQHFDHEVKGETYRARHRCGPRQCTAMSLHLSQDGGENIYLEIDLGSIQVRFEKVFTLV